MILLNAPNFQPSFFKQNGHLQTVLPTLYRKISDVQYARERLELQDGDFLDIDFSCKNNTKIAIISHGLEGNSYRGYVRGMVRALGKVDIDSAAWNFRGCSGEPNRLLKSYHSGVSADLSAVIDYVRSKNTYSEIYLIGFSMGGNITLKYLGEKGETVPNEIKSAVTFSVPCHLASSGVELAKFQNKIYMSRFLRQLKTKMYAKQQQFGNVISLDNYSNIKDFYAFDNRFTAPLNGFSSADDYYDKCSSLYFLPNIKLRTLLVNAKNDPFLSAECFPTEIAEKSKYLHLLTPENGGHVGFVDRVSDEVYWSEKVAIDFIEGRI